jgi:phosphate transport system substrate-binding protein
VPNLGSSGGIRAVATGAVQIGAVSRPLKPAEAAKGLSAIRYGRTAFVVVTRETGVHSLTPDELAAMYDSPEARWPDGTPVRPVLRPASDNDSRLLAAFSPAVSTALTKAMAREGMVVGMTDQETVDAVERLPGAIGTASMALLLSEQRRVTPLALAGVAPSLANVASGRYPHSKTMALVLRSDAPEAARRFVAFVGSEAGRRLLKSLGHVTDEPGAAGASPSAGPTGR